MSSNQDQDENVRHYGRLRPILGGKGRRSRLLLGPQWHLHIAAFVCFLASMAFFDLNLAAGLSRVWIIGISTAQVLAFIFFGSIGLSNPGLEIEQENQIPFEFNQYCRICRVVRGRTSLHCSQCDTCVIQYDHHCPWVGKCVGRDNKTQFTLFVGSVCTCLILVLAGLVLRLL